MEFNRLISLVIGFIVLILVFVWIGSRFRSATTTSQNSPTATVTATKVPSPTLTADEEGRTWNPFGFLFNRNTPTPTKTVAKKVTASPVKGSPTQVVQVANGSQGQQNTTVVYKNTSTGQTTTLGTSGITKIPETGASTLIIPLAFSALTLGAYLRKRA